MKSIKFCSALLLLLSVTVGCEKESIESSEVQLTEKQEPVSLYDLIDSGVDIESHISKVQKIESRLTYTNKSHTESSSLDYGAAFFGSFCDNLSVEGFELGRMEPGNAGIFTGPLNHYASVGKFQPGEILEGLSISTKSDVTSDKPILGLYGQEVRDSYSKVIYAQIADHDLVIDFTNGGVQSVSLDILSFPYLYEFEDTSTGEPVPYTPEPSQKVTVEVTYASGVVHTEFIDAAVAGVFWGTTGTESEKISRIVLSSTNNDAFIGVDNIAFGLCEDNDADGCLDDEDGHLNSNLEATVKIGGCDTGVANQMTAACGISMSDLMDGLELGKYRNRGSWQSAVSGLADQWIAAGLITLTEKDALTNCASSFNYLQL